jgi:hypothetical protein
MGRVEPQDPRVFAKWVNFVHFIPVAYRYGSTPILSRYAVGSWSAFPKCVAYRCRHPLLLSQHAYCYGSTPIRPPGSIPGELSVFHPINTFSDLIHGIRRVFLEVLLVVPVGMLQVKSFLLPETIQRNEGLVSHAFQI